MILRRIFCNHTYIKTVSCNSERNGTHNYVYNYEYYECEKCKKRYTVKILGTIDENYYINYIKNEVEGNQKYIKDIK